MELLDLLADLYLDLDHPRKRKTLAQAMVERGDSAVQSLGWQRLSMLASDRGRLFWYCCFALFRYCSRSSGVSVPVVASISDPSSPLIAAPIATR